MEENIQRRRGRARGQEREMVVIQGKQPDAPAAEPKPDPRAAEDHMRGVDWTLDGRPRPRARALTARRGSSACGAKGTAPARWAHGIVGISRAPRACCLDRGDVGHPPRCAPPATGRRSLFIFRGAGARPTGSTAARPHHRRHRHAPVARGSRDAAPLPSHAWAGAAAAALPLS